MSKSASKSSQRVSLLDSCFFREQVSHRLIISNNFKRPEKVCSPNPQSMNDSESLSFICVIISFLNTQTSAGVCHWVPILRLISLQKYACHGCVTCIRYKAETTWRHLAGEVLVLRSRLSLKLRMQPGILDSKRSACSCQLALPRAEQ